MKIKTAKQLLSANKNIDPIELQFTKLRDETVSEFRSLLDRLNFQRQRILEPFDPDGFMSKANHDADFYMVILRRIYRIIESLAISDSRVANLKGKHSGLFCKIKIRDHFEHEIDYEKLPFISPGVKVSCCVIINKSSAKIISGDKEWHLNNDHNQFIKVVEEVQNLYPYII